jgi:hypothetical protein
VSGDNGPAGGACCTDINSELMLLSLLRNSIFMELAGTQLVMTTGYWLQLQSGIVQSVPISAAISDIMCITI